MILFAQEICRFFMKSVMAMVPKLSFPTMLILARLVMVITTQEPQEKMILLHLSASKVQTPEMLLMNILILTIFIAWTIKYILSLNIVHQQLIVILVLDIYFRLVYFRADHYVNY